MASSVLHPPVESAVESGRHQCSQNRSLARLLAVQFTRCVATVRKTYSVDIVVSADDIDRGKIMKIGEVPRFGDSLRGRGVELLEGDQENLRKG